MKKKISFFGLALLLGALLLGSCSFDKKALQLFMTVRRSGTTGLTNTVPAKQMREIWFYGMSIFTPKSRTPIEPLR